MMPLGLLSMGEKAEVLTVPETERICTPSEGASPSPAANCCRIAEMGLRTGKTIEMLNNDGGNAILVRIDETRIAIGRGIAMKVMVRRKD